MYSPSFPARYDRNSVMENCIGFTGIREMVNSFRIMGRTAHIIFGGHHHGVILYGRIFFILPEDGDGRYAITAIFLLFSLSKHSSYNISDSLIAQKSIFHKKPNPACSTPSHSCPSQRHYKKRAQRHFSPES